MKKVYDWGKSFTTVNIRWPSKKRGNKESKSCQCELKKIVKCRIIKKPQLEYTTAVGTEDKKTNDTLTYATTNHWREGQNGCLVTKDRKSS